MFDLIPFEFDDGGLMRSFDNFEKHFFREMNKSMNGFRTDIEDKGDHYLLEAELPGFDKKDIRVELEDGWLTVHAEHTEDKEEKSEKTYVRKADAIKGEYKDGVLKLTLPKAAPAKPAPRQIDIQ